MSTALRQPSQHLATPTLPPQEVNRQRPPVPALELFAPGKLSDLSNKARVRVAADNRLLRGSLLRILSKRADLELAGIDVNEVFLSESFQGEGPDLLLLASRGTLAEDIAVIRHIRTRTPAVR